MSPRLWCFLLSTVVLMAPGAFADPIIVNFDFGAVRIACGNGYAYQGPAGLCMYKDPEQNFNSSPGFGWMLGSVVSSQGPASGLTGPNTAFSPPPFNGMPFNQAVFLQGISWVLQSVEGFTAGNYTLSFHLGSRYTSGIYDGNQTVVALIDGNVIGSWALSSYSPFTLETATFTVTTDGNHKLEFRAINYGDHTAFLSYVTITPTAEQ